MRRERGTAGEGHDQRGCHHGDRAQAFPDRRWGRRAGGDLRTGGHPRSCVVPVETAGPDERHEELLARQPVPAEHGGGGGVGRDVAGFLARTLPDGSGGTVITAHGDRITYCEGFGLADRAARIAATCDTVYDVMSITKQFTAAAILKLEAMGELRVTDPISAHLGPLPGGERGITLHHLLTHTAGLPEALGDDHDPVSRDGLLVGAPAAEPAGAEFRYSNTGYSVLAAIVERVSGLSYEGFLAEHLFGPAGMTATGYVLPRWDRHRVAVEYDARGSDRGRPYEHPWADDGPHWNLRGNGGMLSTARDLFRWHRALTGDAVLPAASQEEALHRVRAGAGLGRGVRVRLEHPRHRRRPDRLARRRQRMVAGELRAVPRRRHDGLLGQQPRLPAGSVELRGPGAGPDPGPPGTRL
ncbi:serine hydrolase domain-containing protein [Nonomuraea sp. NPDC050478]|uniref:serine hydrolase domain-containing protein n=1 Tax=Nonomuraea sp. NPDC050478 TaxID=3364365 RepID=UPI003789B95F